MLVRAEERATKGINRVQPQHGNEEFCHHKTALRIPKMIRRITHHIDQFCRHKLHIIVTSQHIHQILDQVGTKEAYHLKRQEDDPRGIAHDVFLEVRGRQHQERLTVVLVLHALEHQRRTNNEVDK